MSSISRGWVCVGYCVRNAEIGDLPFIQVELEGFAEFYGSDLFKGQSTTEYGVKFLTDLITHHVFLVCTKNGSLCGFIAGFKSGHFFNQSKTTLTEIFWWVKPEFRSARPGYLLLKAYAEIGKDFDWCVMTLEHNSPVNPSSMNKFGFKLKEYQFVLEKGF